MVMVLESFLDVRGWRCHLDVAAPSHNTLSSLRHLVWVYHAYHTGTQLVRILCVVLL